VMIIKMLMMMKMMMLMMMNMLLLEMIYSDSCSFDDGYCIMMMPVIILSMLLL